MKRNYADDELKVLILSFIERKGRWGEHYFPIDSMANHLGKAVQNNGKNVRRKVKDLAKEGFLILHKGKTTASLNPRMKHDIMERIDDSILD